MKTDVLIIGGGLPGVCAAIQAARLGCEVVLVERGTTLGGNCGPEIGVCPSDGHRFHPYMSSTGIVGELIEDAAWMGAKTHSNWHLYNISNLWDTVMARSLQRAGVCLLRRHYAHTPVMDGSRIAGVICEDTAAYKTVRIDVRVAVIDDSGDGNVSARAGAEWRMGREAKSEYGERSAQDAADNVTMGSSLVALLRKTDRPIPFVPPEGTPPFHPSYREMTPFAPKPEEECAFFYPCETGGDMNTIEDDHEIYDRLLGQLYSAWNRVKNVTHVEEARNWELVWISSRVAKRESRRFVGDYTLTQTDVENGRMFDDAVAVGGFALDIHDPRPENPAYIKIHYYSVPPVYGIPYRCMYSANIENLFFASRLLSVTHMAHGTVRVQRTLATIGQAAGAAASLCKRYSCTPRQVLEHLDELRQLLLSEDASVPRAWKHDLSDRTEAAQVTCSSEMRYGVEEKGEWTPLDRVRGCELWDFCDRIDEVQFLVRNETGREAVMTAVLRRFSPPVPWATHNARKLFDYQQYHFEVEWGNEHRTDLFADAGSVRVTLPPGFEGYASFPFHAYVGAKTPTSDDDRMLVLLAPCEGVYLKISDRFYEFVRSVEGIHAGEYIARPRTCCYRLLPEPAYGSANQAVRGSNRRWSTNPINMWRPEALPATLCLRWDQAYTMRKVCLTFDTLLRTVGEMPFERSRRKVSPQCPKSYALAVLKDGRAVWAQEISENHNRYRRHVLPDVQGDTLELVIKEVWEEGHLPGIYDVRVYG